MNTNNETDKATDLVQAGVAALKSGRKADARFLLEQALEADPRSEQSWLWLSGAVDTDDERRFCLTQVLSINEWNPAAQAGLKKLGPGPACSPITLPTTSEPAASAAEEPDWSRWGKEETPAGAAVEPAPSAAEAPVWSRWREEETPAEVVEEPAPSAPEAPIWSRWREEETPAEAAAEPTPSTAEAPIWSRWREEETPTEAATEPAPPAAEAPVWARWRDQATPAEAAATPEPPIAEMPGWSRWRDQTVSIEAAAAPESPAGEALAWSQPRQQAISTEPTRASLPKAWLIITVILSACFLVGLVLLLLVSFGVLGK